jgi:hypothetical protein
MGYEIADGISDRPFTLEDDDAGLEWDCYAVYRTIVVAEGEVLGGVYQEAEEAFAAARRIALGLGNLGRDVDTLTVPELEDVLADDPRVSFSEVAVREVLYA